MEKDLIQLDKIDLVKIFTEGDVDPMLEGMATKAKDFTPNTSTGKGRREIASRSAKVSSARAALDKARKQSIANHMSLIDKVNAAGKKIQDFTANLRDEVRQPLTEWEEEEKSKAEEARLAEESRIEEEKRFAEYLSEWDAAIIDDNLFDAHREIEREKEDKARIKKIQLSINTLRDYMNVVGSDGKPLSVQKLNDMLSGLIETAIDDFFEEFLEEANGVRDNAIRFLTICIKNKKEEEEKIQKEREEKLQREAAEKVREEERKKSEREKEKVLKREAKAKLEKEEATRKQRESEQREKELKDNAAISRHEMLKEIGVNLDIPACREMDESTWNEFYNNKNSVYQEEQNKIWVKEQKEKRDQEKKEEAEKVENDRIVAEEKAERDKQEAIKAEQKRAKEESDRKEAERLEYKRIEKETLELERLEKERKSADLEHRREINQKAVSDVMKILKFSKSDAESIIKSIAKGEISDVTINY